MHCRVPTIHHLLLGRLELEPPVESLDLARGIDEAAGCSGVEGMAVRANVDADVLARRTGGEVMSTTAMDDGLDIFRMNSRFHVVCTSIGSGCSLNDRD